MKVEIKSVFVLGSTSLVAKEICIELAKMDANLFSGSSESRKKYDSL